MNKETRPAFMLYASDWLTGTAEMTLEEKGIFIDMLCHQWLRGDLPADEKKLSRMLGGDANRNAIASVSHKFRICENGGLQNAKLEQVRESSRESQNRRSAANKANADKRWEKTRILENEATLFEGKQPIKEDANRNAIALQIESESKSENEGESRNENMGVQGEISLATLPGFDVHNAAKRFQEIYSKREGKPRQLREAYANCLRRMNAPPWCMDWKIAKGRLEIAAAQFMTYHAKLGTETQFVPFPENFLDGDQWETDWIKAASEIKLSEKKVSEDLTSDLLKNVQRL